MRFQDYLENMSMSYKPGNARAVGSGGNIPVANQASVTLVGNLLQIDSDFRSIALQLSPQQIQQIRTEIEK